MGQENRISVPQTLSCQLMLLPLIPLPNLPQAAHLAYQPASQASSLHPFCQLIHLPPIPSRYSTRNSYSPQFLPPFPCPFLARFGLSCASVDLLLL